ncbi:MAG: hypothetical protein JW772_01220 [Candidatus Diapherotrites archaeon]|nr:hypothetical protein [Candidatus Diapherotrites archaeon]
MADANINMQIERLFRDAKRNCLFCYGRARLRDTETEKNIALGKVEEMRELFEGKYNSLRKADASTEAIQRALENKRICMDAVDTCKNCDKRVDRLNRELGKIK